MQYSRMVLAAAAAWACVAGAVARADALTDGIKASGVVKVGYRTSSVPFSYPLPNGEVVGYSIDVCRRIVDALSADLGKKLEMRLVPVTSAQRFDVLKRGDIDIECATTTNTEERRRTYHVAFTVPYYITGVRALVRTGQGIASLNDLKGKKVAYSAGTTSEIIARKRAPGWGVTVEACGPVYDNCMADLAAGRIQAWLMDSITLDAFRANAPRPQDYQVIGDMLSIEHLAIMFRADQPDFKKAVDEAMKRLMRGHEVRRLYTQWFERPIPPKGVNLGVPPSPLLRNYMAQPTDAVGNYVVY